MVELVVEPKIVFDHPQSFVDQTAISLQFLLPFSIMQKRPKAVFYGLLTTLCLSSLSAFLLIQPSTIKANQNAPVSNTRNQKLATNAPADFFMQYVLPNPSIEFKITEVTPNPNIEYFIVSIP